MNKNKEFLDWLSSILPSHYELELKPNGVHCKSTLGVSEFDYKEINKKFRRQLGSSLLEVFHQVNTRHKEFTIFTKYKVR